MLLVVARLAPSPEAAKRAAEVTGLAPADLSRRLVGILPRVLLPAAPADRAEELAVSLEELGFTVFTCDATAAPGDDDRVVARAIEIGSAGFVAIDGQGRRHDCPARAITCFQRGARVTRKSETVKTSERRLDIGKAVLSGGLMLTTKVEKTSVKTTLAQEPFVLVERRDGEPDVIIYERRMDYRFLGADMQPTSRGNLERLIARLRALAPAAAFDERLARPGFIAGLPLTSTDPVDLALFLVTLARTREA